MAHGSGYPVRANAARRLRGNGADACRLYIYIYVLHLGCVRLVRCSSLTLGGVCVCCRCALMRCKEACRACTGLCLRCRAPFTRCCSQHTSSCLRGLTSSSTRCGGCAHCVRLAGAHTVSGTAPDPPPLCLVVQAAGFARLAQDSHGRGGMPQIFSAIDGTHIPTKKPPHSGDEYVNRKQIHSVLMQACCDADLMFTNINVGWTGRVHDVRAYSESKIGKVSAKRGDRLGALLRLACLRLRADAPTKSSPTLPAGPERAHVCPGAAADVTRGAAGVGGGTGGACAHDAHRRQRIHTQLVCVACLQGA
jgi:hypothetical protein